MCGTSCDVLQHKHKQHQSTTFVHVSKNTLRKNYQPENHTTTINHKLNWACRGHHNNLIRFGFAYSKQDNS